MENLLIAAIAAFAGMATGIVAPVLLAIIAARGARQLKEQDWARQDMVAAQVAKVARVAAETADRTDKKLDEAAAGQAVIHTLVNSTLTASKQAELRALKLLQAITLKFTPQDPELEGLKKQIEELETLLAAREIAAKKVDRQIAAQKAGGVNI